MGPPLLSPGNRPAPLPAWWLDLHNYLGGLALVFVVVHIVTAVLDPSSGVGVIAALIPMTANGATWAVTWGVVGTYTFAAAVLTSWPTRRFSRRTWRIIHLSSLVGFVLALVHGYQLGSDASTTAYWLGFLAVAAVASYAAGLRVLAVVSHRWAR